MVQEIFVRDIEPYFKPLYRSVPMGGFCFLGAYTHKANLIPAF